MTTPDSDSTTNSSNDPGSPVEPDDFDVAVSAVTRAIRAMNADQRPGDGGELITHLLAAVAANLGSSAAVTASRPGSWEAAGVRDLLGSTVGYDDEYLLTHRTTPIELVVNTVDAMDELGIYQTYEASVNHIGQALFGKRWSPARSHLSLSDLERIETVEDQLGDLEVRDRAEYETRFTATAMAEFEQLRTTDPAAYPAQLTVAVRYVDHTSPAAHLATTDPYADGLAGRLFLLARDKTLLPGSETCPHWDANDRFAAELLAGGHWPHLRIPELAHYGTPAATPKDPR